MATTSAAVNALFEDVVASLIPHYDNYTLLPNPMVLTNQYNLVGQVGDTVKVPVTNAWTAGAVVGENASIITAAAQDFDPGSVQLQVGKRGAGTYVTEESLEDGGLATVRNAVLQRLSRSIAQATDRAGFNILASGSATALTDISGMNLSNDGLANTALGSADISFVMSPEAMAYAVKREPTVKMSHDADYDRYEMVATVRNGFVRIPFSTTGGNVFFARGIAASSDIAEANAALRASLDMFSRGVANLRKINAPTDSTGFYLAVVSAAHEFHLAKELNGIGGISSGAIGSVAQALANQALIDGLIGQAVGCRFIRSQNVPTGLLSA